MSYILWLVLVVSVAALLSVKDGTRSERKRLIPRRALKPSRAIATSRENLASDTGMMEIRRAMMRSSTVAAERARAILIEPLSDDQAKRSARDLLTFHLHSELDESQQRHLDFVVAAARAIRKGWAWSDQRLDPLFHGVDRLVESLWGTPLNIEMSLPDLLVLLVTDTDEECALGLLWVQHAAFEWGGFSSARAAIDYLVRDRDQLAA